MANLKLAKLPDRTPVKVTISLTPDLHRTIQEYAEIYRQTYGEDKPEPIFEIIPAMLRSFVDGDRNFARARKTAASGSNDQLCPRQAGNAK